MHGLSHQINFLPQSVFNPRLVSYSHLVTWGEVRKMIEKKKKGEGVLSEEHSHTTHLPCVLLSSNLDKCSIDCFQIKTTNLVYFNFYCKQKLNCNLKH